MLRVACPLQDGVELSRFLSKTGGHAMPSTTTLRMMHRLVLRTPDFAQGTRTIVPGTASGRMGAALGLLPAAPERRAVGFFADTATLVLTNVIGQGLERSFEELSASV